MFFGEFVKNRTSQVTPLPTNLLVDLTHPVTGAVTKTNLQELQNLFAGGNLAIQTLTDGPVVEFDASLGLWAKVTITDNRSFSWQSFANGMSGIVKITQDGVGGRTINWGSAIEPEGGIVLNSDPDEVTFVGYIVMDGEIRLFTEGGAAGLPEISKPINTVSGSSIFTLAAGEVLLGIVVNAVSAQTGFKIGTSAGGDQIVSEQDLAQTTGAWHSFPMLFKSQSNQTFYITAPSGSGVQYQPIILV